MSRWSPLVFAVVLAALPMAPAAARSPSPFEQKVRHLLDVTGAGAIGKQTMDLMLAQFSKMPGLPPGFVDELSQEARPEDMVDLLVPIYMHHLTEDDVDAAIKFFESKHGRDWTAAMPGIVAESNGAGQAWGKTIAQRVLSHLATRGAAGSAADGAPPDAPSEAPH